MLQYEWLVREKIADGALISKWRKPGYEILCSLLAIQKNNHNFGTTSHCRYVTVHNPASHGVCQQHCHAAKLLGQPSTLLPVGISLQAVRGGERASRWSDCVPQGPSEE